MKKLPLILVSTALLAACGTAANSSGANSAAIRLSSGATVVHEAANAGSDVQGDLDINRVNPPIGKANAVHPVPPAQPRAATAPTPAFGIAQDRCSGGIWNGPLANGPNSPSFGAKRPPLPACMAQ